MRSFKPTILCGVLLASMAAPGLAETQDWKAVAESDNAKVFFNMASMKRSGDIVTVWAKEDLFAPRPAAKKGRTFQSSRVEYRFDCAQRRLARASIKAYAQPDLAGEVVQKASSSEKNLQWSAVAPGGLDEAILNFACAQ